ncbi:hypothetical protein N8I74_14410 [Chitiniphilus purpureus]|uniref:Peptidase C39-like domain-containing protein n=1 Tax=Chitiniphilus purpureus TaxID=2981137 RepID=A0ABY6DLZ4_9NEIS|nr:papain-like cysteine protease family protein [Chitiniphilus sp. CD1]UXY14501.1 hypothetical protein N8I74_14410 [Chitiniphilus sp. CD1]
MPLIRANRESVDDRFSVLGFTIRTESPLFEVGIATDPELFRPERRAQRSRSNFYSSRAGGGAIRARRGEAVYLVPADVLANFVGQPRLYFGLATYAEGGGGGVPDAIQVPGAGNMYVNISGLTGRGLRRLVSSAAPSSYGPVNGHDASLAWGGDAQAPAARHDPSRAAEATPRPDAGRPPAAADYDDGFGVFPNPTPATAPAPTAQALAQQPKVRVTDQARRPVHAPSTGVLGQTEARLALAALTVLQPPLIALVGALRLVVDRYNVSIGIGPSVSAGLLVGGGLGAGLIFAPGGKIGYYGQFDVRAGLIDSASAELQITIVKGGIEAFGGISFAVAVEVDLAVSVSAQALFDTTPSFQGVTFGAGAGLGVEPIQVFIAMQGSAASVLGQSFDAPVHADANAADSVAQALAIPLDPGQGGRSIGLDALHAGDLIVSTARHPVSYLIRAGTLSAISHTLLYIGGGKVIEAVGDGVREVNLGDAIGDAILAVAYRDPRVDAAKAAAIVAYAKSRLGQPYNYAGVAFSGYRTLNPGGALIIDRIARLAGLQVGQASASYCSELVYDAFKAAGVTLPGALPAESRPSDVVDLFDAKKLVYVGHLIARDEILLLGIDDSHALSGQSFAVHWTTVPYYPQTSRKSCWAASAAMVVGWRDNRHISDKEIADAVLALDAYRTGLWPKDRHQLANAWNLVPEPPASYGLDQWREWLEQYGPLYIDMTWDEHGGGHARVLVGMQSDGAPDGSDTYMYLHDPWPSTGGRLKLTYAQFVALYEGRTGNSGGQLQYQVLHSAALPTHVHANTAAPFALATAALSDPAPQPAEPVRLPPPPEPLVQQQQLESRPLSGGAIEIASAVVGAVMERLVNNEGDITWELDQLRGMKHPNDAAPNPLPAAHNGPTIRLTDWPAFTNHLGDEISAGFEINWQYNGQSVGNVLISNVATNDAVGWGLSVKAKIMDDNIVYPRDNPTFAALKVRFEYRFTRTIGSDLIAIRDVHLFGNGRYNLSSRWEQS